MIIYQMPTLGKFYVIMNGNVSVGCIFVFYNYIFHNHLSSGHEYQLHYKLYNVHTFWKNLQQFIKPFLLMEDASHIYNLSCDKKQTTKLHQLPIHEQTEQ